MHDTLKRLQRRRLLKMLAGTATLPLLARQTALAWNKPQQETNGQAKHIRHAGCLLMDNAAGRELLLQTRMGNPGAGQAIESTGDKRFDHALGIMLADLASRFQVRPEFGFYDDGQSPNALAMPVSRFSDSQGSVLFGLHMLDNSVRDAHGDWFVMGICAHEFGHIVQFFSNYHQRLTENQPTNKLVELHADLLSGYYLGLRAADYHYSPAELLALGRFWETLGDSDYTSSNHHGTDKERLRAIETGFAFARERPEFGIMAACEVGAKYLDV